LRLNHRSTNFSGYITSFAVPGITLGPALTFEYIAASISPARLRARLALSVGTNVDHPD
jgi:hypothetical protein